MVNTALSKSTVGHDKLNLAIYNLIEKWYSFFCNRLPSSAGSIKVIRIENERGYPLPKWVIQDSNL